MSVLLQDHRRAAGRHLRAACRGGAARRSHRRPQRRQHAGPGDRQRGRRHRLPAALGGRATLGASSRRRHRREAAVGDRSRSEPGRRARPGDGERLRHRVRAPRRRQRDLPHEAGPTGHQQSNRTRSRLSRRHRSRRLAVRTRRPARSRRRGQRCESPRRPRQHHPSRYSDRVRRGRDARRPEHRRITGDDHLRNRQLSGCHDAQDLGLGTSAARPIRDRRWAVLRAPHHGGVQRRRRDLLLEQPARQSHGRALRERRVGVSHGHAASDIYRGLRRGDVALAVRAPRARAGGRPGRPGRHVRLRGRRLARHEHLDCLHGARRRLRPRRPVQRDVLPFDHGAGRHAGRQRLDRLAAGVRRGRQLRDRRADRRKQDRPEGACSSRSRPTAP